MALLLPAQEQSFLSPSRSADLLVPETPDVEGKLPGRRPDAEFVAVGVGELRPFAPGFSAQLLGKRDPTRFERRTGCFDIVGVQDVASEARFVATTLAAQAKHEMGLCSGRSDFEPALGFV